MPQQTGKRKPVESRRGFELRLSHEGKAALIKVAELQSRPVADVVRTAISNYLHDLGVDVDVSPGQHGGARVRKDSGKGQGDG